jgi:hypothetical protein
LVVIALANIPLHKWRSFKPAPVAAPVAQKPHAASVR